MNSEILMVRFFKKLENIGHRSEPPNTTLVLRSRCIALPGPCTSTAPETVFIYAYPHCV